MTSGHKLAAIVVIWVVVAALGMMLSGLALSVNQALVIVLASLLFLSGAGAAVAVAPARGGNSGQVAP